MAPSTPEAAGNQRAGSSLLSSAGWVHIAAVFDLPPRQLEVVQHVLAGHQEAGIGLKMGIDKATVHEHMKRIYLKMDVHDRAELILRVVAEYLRWLEVARVSDP